MLIVKFTSVFLTHIFRESRKEPICFRKQFSYRLAIDEMKLLGQVSGF